jgi:hypothetical protein
MKIHGAVVKEQGITFGILIVKQGVLSDSSRADSVREAWRNRAPFHGVPLVLAEQDSRGRFEYFGRRDLVDFLASISASRIPWKEYTLSE